VDELGPNRWQNTERAVCKGDLQPPPLPYGRGSDGARQSHRYTAAHGYAKPAAMGTGDMADDCLLASNKASHVDLGAPGGQDARAPRNLVVSRELGL
jgi:hypothetical protein